MSAQPEEVIEFFTAKSRVLDLHREIREANGGGYRIREINLMVYEKLLHEEPGILNAFLREVGLDAMHDMFRRDIHRSRSVFATNLKDTREEFGEKVLEFMQTRDTKVLEDVFENDICVAEDGTFKRIGDILKGEAGFVAKSYRQNETQARMRAVLWEQIEKQIPAGKTLREVMTPKEFVALMRTI